MPLSSLFANVTKARVVPVLLAVALAQVGVSCTAPPQFDPLPTPPEIPYGHGRIWQVERPGEPKSYLFGTMHVSDPRVYDLPEAAETAFLDAKVILVEVDYRRGGTYRQREEYTDLPKGKNLEDVIGSTDYRHLQNLVWKHNLHLLDYFRRQPWVIWMALSNEVVDIDNAKDEEKPVLDDWLVLRARKAGREVKFLESRFEQWQALAAIPMDDQVAMLHSAIDSYRKTRIRVDPVAVYIEGNGALAYALWQHRLADLTPELAEGYTDRFVNDRNRLMVERMIPLMQKASTFVAVGALHMPGEEGVLRLLEQEGYTVTRLQ